MEVTLTSVGRLRFYDNPPYLTYLSKLLAIAYNGCYLEADTTTTKGGDGALYCAPIVALTLLGNFDHIVQQVGHVAWYAANVGADLTGPHLPDIREALIKGVLLGKLNLATQP